MSTQEKNTGDDQKLKQQNSKVGNTYRNTLAANDSERKIHNREFTMKAHSIFNGYGLINRDRDRDHDQEIG